MELIVFFLHGVYVPRRFIILTNMFLSCKYLIQLDMTGIIYLSFLVSFFLRFINITVGYSTFSGWSIFRRHLLSLLVNFLQSSRVMKHFVTLLAWSSVWWLAPCRFFAWACFRTGVYGTFENKIENKSNQVHF